MRPLIEKKWYKECPPEETINRIRTILYKVGIFTTEESGSCGDFYHSHVYISNFDLRQFNICTNGKGRTPAYALASAYSEMMERLQNGYKFYGTRYSTTQFLKELSPKCEYNQRLSSMGANLSYSSFEDERYICLKEYLLSTNNQFTKEQTSYILENADDDLLDNFQLCCIPYYNLISKEYKLFPADCFLSGSNGMCAGNTSYEAIVQGFCEIFERFALKKILIEEDYPALIPLSYFDGTEIYEKIQALEHTKVIVLDCSYNKALPVVGVIIIDEATDTYCLEMAGAATATIALERCMTEHFQDGDPSLEMPGIYENIKFDRDERYSQFYKQSAGFCKFDIKKLLKSTSKYKFEGFHTIEGDNSKEEFLYIINNIIIPNKWDCYIRDNSILGYPSYHIYIPDVSDIYENCNPDDLFITLKSIYMQSKILALKSQDQETILQICRIVEKSYSRTRCSHIHLFSNFLYNSYLKKNRPDIYLFLATLYLYCNSITDSIRVLEKFVFNLNCSSDVIAKRYYNCVLDCLKIINVESNPAPQIKRLSVLYGTELVDEVWKDIVSKDALQYYSLPTCFQCEKCTVKQFCFYSQAMSIVNKIQKNSLLINQNTIENLIK